MNSIPELGLYRFNYIENGWSFPDYSVNSYQFIIIEDKELIYILEIEIVKDIYKTKLLKKDKFSKIHVYDDFFWEHFEKIK
jgi:hypothetical protein